MFEYVARVAILPVIRVRFDVLDDFLDETGNTEFSLLSY